MKKRDKRIVFTGSIYDPETLYALRANCHAYIHGYTVGGTNPSLLEQLPFGRPILAYDVTFHREILKEVGIYFKSVNELVKKIEDVDGRNNFHEIGERLKEAAKRFTWDEVALGYTKLFIEIIKRK